MEGGDIGAVLVVRELLRGQALARVLVHVAVVLVVVLRRLND